MARFLFLATLAVALTCSAKADNTDITEFQHARQFVDWFSENHVDGTVEEIEYRFNIFRDNVDFILQHNARYANGLETYRVGLNQYADLTLEEYSSLVLGFRSRNASANATTNSTITTNPTETEQLRGRFGGRSSISSGPRINPWKWLCKRFRWGWFACRTELSSSTGSADMSSSSGAADLSSSSVPVSLLLSSSSAEPVFLSSSTGSSDSSSSSAEPVLLSSSSSGASESSSSSSTGVAVNNDTYVDWRNSGFVGPVRNQLFSCGSTAFATLASMESAQAQQSGEFVPLSLQQLLDCTANGTQSCSTGGSFEDVWSYLFNSTDVQVANETSYPLTYLEISECSTSITGVNFTSVVRLPSGNESALLEASRTVPSIATAFNVASRGFMFYNGGVFTDSACTNTTESLNHALSVVGFGTSEIGQDYWLVQNSVGSIWGEGGYAKIARGSNMCGIITEASYVVA